MAIRKVDFKVSRKVKARETSRRFPFVNYSSIIEAMRLWYISFSSSKNCLLGLILPVVPFLLDHPIDFNTSLAQPSVSAMRPPKSFSFDGQFDLITPVPIAMTIFLEITPPAIRAPVPCLSLLQKTRHLRGLVYLFFCARWHYYFFCLFQSFSSSDLLMFL